MIVMTARGVAVLVAKDLCVAEAVVVVEAIVVVVEVAVAVEVVYGVKVLIIGVDFIWRNPLEEGFSSLHFKNGLRHFVSKLLKIKFYKK